MSAYLQDADFTLYQGDALETLRQLPDESVHCVVTSPPYWGLRDYGTEGQLGLEPTPDAFVANMVELFREVRRVLRRDGTCWLNLGDSYGGVGGTNHDINGQAWKDAHGGPKLRNRAGLKPKDLVGIPWRVAFALQADGWYLRSDIIWSKPNPMPESVTDRPTKAHEYLFLLTRSPRYFFDQDAIREDYTPDTRRVTTVQSGNGAIGLKGISERERWAHSGRNARSVWEIATQPYPEAHFATFPEELARRCIAAGTSERGCCPECGAPWEREVERSIDESKPLARQNIYAPEVTKAGQGTNSQGSSTWGHYLKTETLGWTPTCRCHGDNAGAKLTQVDVDSPGDRAHAGRAEGVATLPAASPCVVLDPFMGSGTVAHVARKLGRRSIGIELNSDYCELAARRLQQQSLLA